MAKKIIERVTELIALHKQFISVLEDLSFFRHLEFLNPRYALGSLHYITLTPLLSYNMPVCTLFLVSNTAEHVKQAIEEMLNACEIDTQCVHIILRDNGRKAMDDKEVSNVGCISHTSAGCTRGSAVTVQRHRLTC